MKKFLCSLSVLTISGLMTVSNANAAGLTGSEWGTDKSPEQYIQFKLGDKVSGSGGCNNIFGSYTLKASQDGNSGKIQFGRIASTRKVCAQPVMRAEFEFLKNLEKIQSYKKSKSRLQLFDKDSRLVLNLRWRDFD